MGSGALALSSLISSCRTNQMNGYDEFINTLEQPPLINNQNFTLAASSENYSIGENYQISGFQFNQSYPSPTIKCQHGDRIKAIFENQIGQDSIIHWHGLIVPPDMDGHPKDAISGGAYEYDFLINQRAGTYWYHPHPDRITGDQVYKGLAGFFIVEDEEEKALDLPNGEFEIPLLIQDRRSTSSGEIVYDPSMHEQMMTGFLGDKVLINGTPAAFKDVKKGRYRVRLLNGSNARIYNIAFQNQLPFTLIGGDGGLLPKALEVDQLLLAPGERADILIDFSKFSQERASLVSLPFDIPSSGGMMNGMGNMMGGSSPEQGASFKLMDFKIIDERVGSIPELPKELFADQATKRVKLGLLLSEVIKQNDLKADDEKVQQRIEDFAQTYESPEEVINWYASNPEERNKVESVVLEDQLVDWVLEKANVTETSLSFEELMSSAQAAG